ncbi:hypothetical protein BDW72DRAFT_157327 [Aspergillus terricola var. indicus]
MVWHLMSQIIIDRRFSRQATDLRVVSPWLNRRPVRPPRRSSAGRWAERGKKRRLGRSGFPVPVSPVTKTLQDSGLTTPPSPRIAFDRPSRTCFAEYFAVDTSLSPEGILLESKRSARENVPHTFHDPSHGQID